MFLHPSFEQPKDILDQIFGIPHLAHFLIIGRERGLAAPIENSSALRGVFELRSLLLGEGLAGRGRQRDGGERVDDLDEAIFEAYLCNLEEVAPLYDGVAVDDLYFFCGFLGPLNL